MIKKKDKKGFTLAEVLITLAIIGVLAAILFPSILANYTERTLKAKRSAFVARMSQAMAELSNEFGNYEDVTCTNPNDKKTCMDNDTGIRFLNDGLSKVYKLAAVCDRDSLDACDIPDNITRQDGTIISLYASTVTFKDYNNIIRFAGGSYGTQSSIPYKNLYPAGFMTKNGESGIVFVNPGCVNKNSSSPGFETHICVNMIFDLNGGKGKPNKVGEDIWFLTTIYPDSPTVAAPRTYNFDDTVYTEGTNASGETIKIGVFPSGSNDGYDYNQASQVCSSRGDNVTIPSLEDAIAIATNIGLMSDVNAFGTIHRASGRGDASPSFRTSTPCNTNSHWAVEAETNITWDNDVVCHEDTTKANGIVACVYDD